MATIDSVATAVFAELGIADDAALPGLQHLCSWYSRILFGRQVCFHKVSFL